MFGIGFDTFASIVKFIGEDLVPKHVIMGLFKALDTFGVAL
jgi:hypothetical protein